MDPDRIALWGSSLGGGHVVCVAAEDPRIAAVVAQIPFNGFPRRVEDRSTLDTLKLLWAMTVDAARGRLGLSPRYIPMVGKPGEVAVTATPQAQEHIATLSGETRVSLWRNEVGPRALFGMVRYRPGDEAHRLRMPILVSIAERDNETPEELSRQIAERAPRGKDLRLRARPSGVPALPLDVAHDFISSVTERVRARRTLRAHRRALLTYDGLPWRGELWLDADLCLGPPSRHPDTLLGPQVVIVDAMIEGIGQLGVIASFQKRLRELQIFLGFVLGMKLEIINSLEEGWVPEVDAEGRITDCKYKFIGYRELSAQEGFPTSGSTQPIERREVARPGLGPYGIAADMNVRFSRGTRALEACGVRFG